MQHTNALVIGVFVAKTTQLSEVYLMMRAARELESDRIEDTTPAAVRVLFCDCSDQTGEFIYRYILCEFC